MKKQKSPREPVQLHIDPTPAETTPEYTLEDIMNEFGGWTKRAPEQDTAPANEPPAARTPDSLAVPDGTQELAPEMPEAAEDAAEIIRVAENTAKEPEQPPDLSAQTMRFAPVSEEPEPDEAPKIWTYKGEPTPEASDARTRLSKEELRERQRQKRLELRELRKTRRREKREDQPERTYASPEEAYSFYCKPDTLRLRLLLCTLLTVASAVLLAFASGILPGAEQHMALFSALMLALMAIQAVLCLDLLMEGVLRAAHLKFDLNSLLLLTTLAAAGDAVFALLNGRIPFCTVVSVELLVALWSRTLLKAAKYKTLKAICSMPAPTGAARSEKAWHGTDCIFRVPGQRDETVRQLEMPDGAMKCGRVYAPVMTGVTLVLAVLTTMRGGNNFLWAWTAMLLAGFPAGLLLSYPRTFQRQASRLYRRGAALGGWRGARTFTGECAVTIMDQDLFPAGSVTLNGMKIYSDRSVSQLIGFASAVVQTAGSGLMPLFDEMMHNQNGRHYRVDTFRRYEGGGLGAEIQGDVILMGSIGFMKLMRVQMPEGTRLKQAVYLSVNGELAAVFALNYAPNAGARASLAAAIHTAGLLPLLATRDFMLTPQFLKLRYKVASDRVEFPTVEERARLSEPDAGKDGTQGALLARDSLESFLAAVTGARAMHSAALGSIVIALMGGLLGMVVLFFLTFLGATLSASCWNLFLYTILWLIPAILLTGFGGRS